MRDLEVNLKSSIKRRPSLFRSASVGVLTVSVRPARAHREARDPRTHRRGEPERADAPSARACSPRRTPHLRHTGDWGGQHPVDARRPPPLYTIWYLRWCPQRL